MPLFDKQPPNLKCYNFVERLICKGALHKQIFLCGNQCITFFMQHPHCYLPNSRVKSKMEISIRWDCKHLDGAQESPSCLQLTTRNSIRRRLEEFISLFHVISHSALLDPIFVLFSKSQTISQAKGGK